MIGEALIRLCILVWAVSLNKHHITFNVGAVFYLFVVGFRPVQDEVDKIRFRQ